MRDQLRPPPPRAILNELTTAREPARLLAHTRTLLRSAAHSRIVMTIPGVGATDRWMAPMRRYLSRLGHRPQGWGLGRNGTRPDDVYPRVAERVVRIAADTGESIDLVGWSIGGVIAREVARDHPDSVGRVFTLGTPVIDGPRYTRAGHRYGVERLDEISRIIAERETVPITTPITAFYSKRDGIVAWRACIDPFGNNVEHVEVSSSHLGLTVDPDVWTGVAQGLDRPSHGTD